MMYKAWAIVIPTAVLASGCDLERPPEIPLAPGAARGTPSASVDAWAEVPAAIATTVLSSGEACARWLLAANNRWAAYQKATLLMALDATERFAALPQVAELDVVVGAQRAASAVAAAGLAPKTMWVVDLRGAASVAFGATLSARSRKAVAPVITFHNWPAEQELIPAEETLAALLTFQPKLPSSNEAGQPLFMLDAWRLAHRDDRPDDEVTDNRYMLTPSDLPAPDALIAQGIDRVLYVVESLDTTTAEEDDLHDTFESYRDAGIAISIVDLRVLEQIEPVPLWDERLFRDHLLFLDPGRVTIVSDPSFYLRARGGFGGPHVIIGGSPRFGGAYGVGGHGGG